MDGLEDGKDGVKGPAGVLADFTMDNIIVADKEDAIDDLSDEDPLEMMRGAEELKVCPSPWYLYKMVPQNVLRMFDVK